MVEAGGIGECGRATAGEDMDGAMADCGGRGRFNVGETKRKPTSYAAGDGDGWGVVHCLRLLLQTWSM